MSWFRRSKNFKRPSGRAVPRRYGEGNTLFKRRQYFWQRRSFKIYVILAFLVLFFLLYLIIWSGIFKIVNVTVNGAKNLDPAKIEAMVRAQLVKSRFGLFSQSNLLFFDSKTAENEVKKAFVIDDIQIRKWPLKTLKIELKEKVTEIALISDNRYYYLDPTGLAVKEILVANITLVEGEAEAAANVNGESLIDLSALDPSLPLVYDLSNSEVKIGQKIVEPTIISFINTLKDKLPQNGINIKSFQLPTRQGTEVRVVTGQGFSIYFNSQDDLDRQLANLKLVLKEKVKDKKINYIDLRFGDRVYIK